ncbi:MAG: TrkH family potassium uptake protein [Acholeplasmataceae bacterium]|nr:TrkH family potassium uptake protein [Acholeplasmataceae bacterium]MDD4193668.1 TrkH family potassium uptake protein [Acholeplasmataceae bacterium]
MTSKILSGYKLIINYLGMFAVLVGIILMVPLTLILFRPEEFQQAHYFFVPGAISILIGTLVLFMFRKYEKGKLERQQDAILVVSIWIMSIIISAMPFYMTGLFSFTESIFEVTSGYSTTGLTVVNVETIPSIFLLYRSLLQFFGGVGFVLVLTSAVSDRLNMRLYNAEGHSDKLVPNLIRSGRIILSIYVGYILIGTIFLMIFGMPGFDALNHATCAVATGGFSTKAASIGFYDNVAIEITIMILMLLGGTNFFVHLMLIKGKLKNVISHVEIKLLGLYLLIFIPLFTISFLNFYQGDLVHSIRYGSFQMISAITGTGYQTIPTFINIPPFVFGGLILLMVLGAGLGSTAGGMKQYRVALAGKSLIWSVKEQLAHKKTIRTHFINRLGTKSIVEKEDINQNHAFLMVYIVVLLIGTLIFTFYGHSFENSLFEFASALGTVGLSVGIAGAGAPNGILWTSTLGMFLGRLEFYVIFVAIAKIVVDLSKKRYLHKES